MAVNLGTIYAELAIKLDEFKKGIAEAEKKFEATGKRLTNVGKGMTVGVTLPIAAAAGGLLKLGKEFDDAYEKIRIGTGATGVALEQLRWDFQAVYAHVPAGMGDVSTAIADLNTRMGLTGPPLRDMATQMLNLSRVTGEELSGLIRSSTRLLGEWSVETEKSASTMDYLFRVSQSTGIGVGTLTAKLTKFGSPLRQMGFDLGEAAALLGKFEKEGINADLAMGGLRIALAKMTQEGVTDAGEGLRLVMERIRGAGSAAEANAMALELFGGRAGPDLAAAIREGRFEIATFVEQLEASQETINGVAVETMDFGEQLTMFRNRAAIAFEPLGGALMEAVNNAMPAIERLIIKLSNLVNWFVELDSGSRTMILAFIGIAAAAGPVLVVVGKIIGVIVTVSKAITAFKAAAAAAKLTVGAFIAVKALLAAKVIAIIAVIALLAAGVYLLISNWDKVREFFVGLWESVRATFTSAVTAVTTLVTNLWTTVQTTFSAGVTAVVGFVTTLWTTISRAFSMAIATVTGFVTNLWVSIRTTFTTAVTAVTGIVQGLWDGTVGRFRSLVDSVRGIISGVTEAIAAPFRRAQEIVGGITSTIGGFLNRINPLARRSPSLVDNVATGVRAIQQEYAKLEQLRIPALTATVMPAIAGAGGAMPRAQTPSGPLFVVENMTVRAETDIELISKQLYRHIQAAQRAKGGA